MGERAAKNLTSLGGCAGTGSASSGFVALQCALYMRAPATYSTADKGMHPSMVGIFA